MIHCGKEIWVILAGLLLLGEVSGRDGSMFYFKGSHPGKKTLIINNWKSKDTAESSKTICKSWFMP